ncbi:Beta-amyrin 11-oxidase [Morella rubra]|uniref:Beta-amyrin 11-oxidase n=1 Tax=Morella rubra TaxID=262757 RepID=A0A6A1VT25_9ROSI|nr:Beta-amyrin 11-oxidase [Morella rubra]KAB1215827.1 Beta-amyrin 11-oxidase [Morella rubra]KAB1215835.1 Beta-amyrin 11-oxidase [Morella rubra]
MESLWLIPALLLGGFVFVFGILRRFNDWYYIGRLGKKQYPLPPGDMGWPYLGGILTFLKAFRSGDPDSYIHNLVSKYGRTGIYKTFMFGNPSVIVCTPETCRKVLTDDDRFKLGYPKATTILTGRRAFHGISNAEHKRLRRLTTSPINGHEALSGYIDLIEGIVATTLEEWASMKHPIELLTELRGVAFKVITNIFISTHSDSVISKVENLYSDLNAGLKSQAINLPGFVFHKALKARKKLMKIFQDILDKKRAMVKKDSSQTESTKDMMDLLLGVKDEDGKQLEDEDIVDLLIVFMLAGHESSAHGALWAVIYMSQNPEVFKKAREEQQEIMKRRPSTQKRLSLAEIRQMDYLSKVIDETLRRTSISFAVFREAKEDVNVNGYLIPKGWKVLVWNRGVHMDPENYSDPKEFNPSRWENNKPRAGGFLPFGLGSRYCPGSDLAKLEITIFLHHYLLNYNVERVNPDGPVNYLPVARPVDMCLARVIKVT